MEENRQCERFEAKTESLHNSRQAIGLEMPDMTGVVSMRSIQV
jgi:hypothetical protein